MHVILCSDSPAVRETITMGFGAHVERLTVCDSGMELLAAVRTLAADLVVLDLGTHGLGGLLLVSAVEELAPGLPIVAVSAGADVDARPVVQKGIPHVVLGAEQDGELEALLAQVTGRRAAALGAGSR
jgi:DNA-binding response OmpR family regulator